MRKFLFIFIVCYLLSRKSSDAKYEHLKSRFMERNSSLTTYQIENLNRVLDFIQSSPDFYPLTLSVIYSIHDMDILALISKFVAGNSGGGYQVEATDFPTRSQWKDRVDLTWIFLVHDWYTVNAFVYWQENFWKAKNQYILIFVGKHQPRKAWKPIFEILWKKHSVYRILITSILDDFKWLVRYSPFDFSRGRYGSFQKVIPVDNLENHNRKWTLSPRDIIYKNLREFFESMNIFSRFDAIDAEFYLEKGSRLFETFNDLKGYPMRVTIFQSLMMNITIDGDNNYVFSRLDANVMRQLEKSLRTNFKIKVIHRTESIDPFQKALEDIRDGETEMVATSFFAKLYEQSYSYEFTTGIYQDKLCFTAPDAGHVPKSYMPILPFEISFWLLLIAYNFIITILWYLLKYCSQSFYHDKPILKPLSKAQYILVEEKQKRTRKPGHTRSFAMDKKFCQDRIRLASKRRKGLEVSEVWEEDEPAKIHPHVLACCDLIILSCYPLQGVAETTAQRTFLFGTLFFGVIIGGLYQSFLVSSLSKPLQYPQLDTLEDVANSNLTIITKYTNLKNTFTIDSPFERKLREKIKIVTSKQPTLDMVAFNKNVVALGRLASLQLENLTKYYDDEGHELLHTVEECPATYTLAYVVALHSPFLERVGRLILSMQQNGLVRMWYENMTRPIQAEEQRRKQNKGDRKIKLTLEHYALTFLGLFLSLLCCTCVFACEYLFARKFN